MGIARIDITGSGGKSVAERIKTSSVLGKTLFGRQCNQRGHVSIYVFMSIKQPSANCGRAIPSDPGVCKVSPRHTWTPGGAGLQRAAFKLYVGLRHIFAASTTIIRGFTPLLYAIYARFAALDPTVFLSLQKTLANALSNSVQTKASHDVLKLRHLVAAKLGLSYSLISH